MELKHLKYLRMLAQTDLQTYGDLHAATMKDLESIQERDIPVRQMEALTDMYRTHLRDFVERICQAVEALNVIEQKIREEAGPHDE